MSWWCDGIAEVETALYSRHKKEHEMQTLNFNQVAYVSGGLIKGPDWADHITCTVGTDGVNCTGSLSDFGSMLGACGDLLHDTGEWWGGHIYDWTH